MCHFCHQFIINTIVFRHEFLGVWFTRHFHNYIYIYIYTHTLENKINNSKWFVLIRTEHSFVFVVLAWLVHFEDKY